MVFYPGFLHGVTRISPRSPASAGTPGSVPVWRVCSLWTEEHGSLTVVCFAIHNIYKLADSLIPVTTTLILHTPLTVCHTNSPSLNDWIVLLKRWAANNKPEL